jgi:hypothetical protein
MSNDLFKRNCAVLAQWYAGECREVLQAKDPEACDGYVTVGSYNGDALSKWELRIKPRTITVNGIEVPEPVREPLNNGKEYWSVSFGAKSCVGRLTWAGDDFDLAFLDRGLIHMTAEAAQQHAEAMIAPSKQKKT